MEETLVYLSEVPKPPKCVLFVPEKFYKWVERAKEYMKRDEKIQSIQPFGEVFGSEEDYYEFWGI